MLDLHLCKSVYICPKLLELIVISSTWDLNLFLFLWNYLLIWIVNLYIWSFLKISIIIRGWVKWFRISDIVYESPWVFLNENYSIHPINVLDTNIFLRYELFPFLIVIKFFGLSIMKLSFVDFMRSQNVNFLFSVK